MSKNPFEDVIGNPPEKPKYTLADLEEECRRIEGYVGPNNIRAQERWYRQHEERRKEIEDYLVSTGELRNEPRETEPTEYQLTNEALDKLYPNAKSKTIVTYQGKRYQARYWPKSASNSGKTVYDWSHDWKLLEKKDGEKK